MTTNGTPIRDTKQYFYRLKAGGQAIKTRYDYVDGSKSFKWPPGTKMGDIRLYGADWLPDVTPDKIILVEGEKTADALWDYGFFAVSLPGGAGQKDLSALDELKDYAEIPVYVSPDNNGVGLSFMELCHKHLKRFHKEVKWIAPVTETPGGDFADLLAPYGDDVRAARKAANALIDAALDGPPETDTGLGIALPIWEMKEPEPRVWLVEDFIPDRWPTLLYGDGGAGKTTLATHLALHIAVGRDWFGRRVSQTNVLIVDAELDEIEAARRVWPLARGMSLDAPPQGVYYWRLPKALSDEDVLDHLFGLITRNKIGFVIVDSLTIATHASDQNTSNDLLKLVFGLQKWGVPFQFIDHHAKTQVGGDPDSTSPYGSVYKRNAVRAMTYMQTGVKGSARLHCRKSNFGPKWEPFSIAAEWLGVWPSQSIVYQRLADNDPRNLAMKSEEVKNETVEALRALVDEYPEGIPTKAIADYLSISEDTARMRLMRAEKLRPPMASRVDRGKWLPLNEPPPPEPNR
jgi:hypothetical protein